MNMKILASMSFILLLIFSTIGCLMSNISPTEDVTILTKDYQVQEFVATPMFLAEITWTLDGVIVLCEDLNMISNRNYAIYTLNWNDLSSGRHMLILDDGSSRVEWTIDVIKPEGIQSETEDIEEQFSWNDTRSEWKEKADKLMNGEEK